MSAEPKVATVANSPARAIHSGTSGQVAAPARSLWRDALRRLVANKLAVGGGIFILMLVLLAIFAPLVAPKGYTEQDYGSMRVFPNGEYWLGTDATGRDLWARIIYGARISLLVAFSTQAIALLIGVPLGLLAGFAGGWVDTLLMRVVDILYAFPNLLFAVLLMNWLRPGLSNVILALSVTGWLLLCRLVRAQTLALREREFVQAARALGIPTHRILWRHILPNTLPVVITATTFAIPQAIFAEAALSFIGVGVTPPTPSWGEMISENTLYIRSAWHLAVFPALALGLTMLAFTTFGDGLRDALDPRGSR
jgi:oligopeptide transport system permease protein